MWGLDDADPRISIAAMQAMNASVRNAVFAPAFFGTPVALLITTILFYARGQSPSAHWFAAATVLIVLLAFVLTMMVNVPMNEALAQLTVPEDINAAREIWLAYSPDWQLWNQIRTVASGAGLLCIGIGITRLV